MRRTPRAARLTAAVATVATVAVAVLLVAAGSRLAGRSDAGVPSPDATATSALPLEYPPGATEQFLEYCVRQGASRRVCACVIDELTEDLTYPQFVAFELRLHSDPEARPPEDVISAFEECAAKR